MKRRSARLAVLLAATATLLVTATPPVSATTGKNGVFLGTAVTGPLGYPCVPMGTLKCLGVPTVGTGDPFKGIPTATINPAGGNTVGFAFSSSVCVKGSLTAKPPGDGKPTGVALCGITAAGVISGYCGFATARGVLTLLNLGPPPFDKATVTVDFTMTETAQGAVLTGESGNTQVVAVVVTVPAPPSPIGSGGSCTNKTSTTRTVLGDFTIITKTLVP